MAEFLRLSEKCGGQFDPSCAWLAAFEDAYISQSNLKQIHKPSGERPMVYFDKYWKKELQEFQKLIEEESECDQEETLIAREKLLKQFPYADWMLAIGDGAIFPKIKSALRGGWPVKKLFRFVGLRTC